MQLVIHTCTLYDSPIQNVTSEQPECASWDFDLKRMYIILVSQDYLTCIKLSIYTEWTTEGCETAEVNGDAVTCHCNHLTNFAILVVSILRVCVGMYIV